MEPRKLILPVTLVIGGGLGAQSPTLTNMNNVPAAGLEYPVDLGTFGWPGGTGADQTYGFWMLQSTGNRDIEYLAPSVTPTSSMVPGVTHLSTDGGTDTLFWRANASGLDLLAEKNTLLGLVVYSDPGIERQYPCTFNTTWSDAIAASYTTSGIPVVRSGSITGVADGYGTLELPAAGVPNVLRIKVRKVISDVSAIVTVDRISETYYFFTELVPHPLLRLQIDTTIINNGGPTVTRESQWMFGEGQIGFNDLSVDDIRFTAYPNPATDLVNLSVEEGTQVRYVEVMDATGRIALRRDLPGDRNDGIQGAFDVSDLAPGVYHVRLMATTGLVGSQRLVVN